MMQQSRASDQAEAAFVKSTAQIARTRCQRNSARANSYQPGINQYERVKMAIINRATWPYRVAVKQLQKTEQESGIAIKQAASYYKFSAL